MSTAMIVLVVVGVVLILAIVAWMNVYSGRGDDRLHSLLHMRGASDAGAEFSFTGREVDPETGKTFFQGGHYRPSETGSPDIFLSGGSRSITSNKGDSCPSFGSNPSGSGVMDDFGATIGALNPGVWLAAGGGGLSPRTIAKGEVQVRSAQEGKLLDLSSPYRSPAVSPDVGDDYIKLGNDDRDVQYADGVRVTAGSEAYINPDHLKNAPPSVEYAAGIGGGNGAWNRMQFPVELIHPSELKSNGDGDADWNNPLFVSSSGTPPLRAGGRNLASKSQNDWADLGQTTSPEFMGTNDVAVSGSIREAAQASVPTDSSTIDEERAKKDAAAKIKRDAMLAEWAAEDAAATVAAASGSDAAVFATAANPARDWV